jgi:hypothetical protein
MTIDFDFNESRAWTKTRITTLEKIDPNPERRCENCPSIAEYVFGIDFINEGEEHGRLDLCPGCVAEYSKGFDENNIFRR